jgi:uncharacterized delta-60 repeat protein
MKKNLILIYFIFYSSYTFAQRAGSLDVSFGGTGVLSTSISAGLSGGYTAIQPDGKIIVGGDRKYSISNPPTPNTFTTELILARYNQNGTLDNTFGTNGIAAIIFGNSLVGYGNIYRLSLQADGKIVAVGTNASDKGIILRLNTNGTLDNTFDGDGIKEITSIGGFTIGGFRDLAFQPDGKIILVGRASIGTNYDFCIIRVNTDGSLDLGFDNDGLQTTYFGATNFFSYENAESVKIQSDGKIVVAGNENLDEIVLARYTTSGALDTSFDGDGKLMIIIPATNYGASLVIQPDGKITVGCYASTSTSLYYFSLIRLNANGSFDLTFDSDGFVATTFSNDAYIQDLKLQPDGKIIASGNKSGIVYIVCYNPDGSLDTSFNLTGIYTSSIFGASGYCRSGVLQVDGKLIIGGTDNSNFKLARLHGITNFNSNKGKMITQVGTSTDIANAVAIRPNGKIITAGYAYNAINGSSNNDFVLVGYNADGSLDYTFGSNAIVKTEVAAFSNDQIKAMSLLSDGKILVVGESISGSQKNIVVAKYLANGSGLDLTFGAGGMSIVTFGLTANINVNAIAVDNSGLIFVGGSIVNALVSGVNTDFMLAKFSSTGSYISYVTFNFVSGYNVCYSLAIQPDSKIILAGQAGGDFAMTRYNFSTLTLDSTFGTIGKVTTSFGTNTFEEVRGVALQTDGKILVSGNTDINGSDDFAVIRYNSNGSLDNTFGSGGKAIVGFGLLSGDLYPRMSLHTSGKIVLAGQANYGIIGICRLNTNGTLDTGFDGDGKMTLDIGYGIDQVNALALQTDGKMILAGNYANGSNDDFALLRINGINNFSVNNGKMITLTGYYGNEAAAMIEQPDGKIILGGSMGITKNASDFGMIRYNIDGSLDNTFDTDGIVNTNFGVGAGLIYALALQTDSKIVAVGPTNYGVGPSTLARYNSNGSLDNTFGSAGSVSTAIGSTNTIPTSVAIQTDGKILVVGNAFNSNPNVFVARYTASGVLDASFGTNGITITSISAFSVATSLAIQSDGKMVIGGYATVGSFHDFMVARYTTTGILDNTFGTGGILTFPFGTGKDQGISLAIQTDGKIVIGGVTDNGVNDVMAIARITASGILDNTFDTDGKVTIDIGTGINFLQKLKILSNGKILVTGNVSNVTSGDIAIIRLNTNGSLDNSFNVNGKYTKTFGYQSNDARDIIYQPSTGNYLVGGNYNSGGNSDFFLLKVMPCDIETPILVNSADNYPNAALPNPQIGKSITATNFVLNPSNLSYQVNEKVDFLPGFKAENVTLFKTDIAGCSY